MLIDFIPTIAEVLDGDGYHTMAFNQWIHSGKVVSLDRGFDEYTELPKGDAQLLFGDQIAMLADALKKTYSAPFYLYFHPNSLHFNFHLPYQRAASIEGFLASVEHFSIREQDRLIVKSRKRKPDESLVWRAYEAQIRYVDDEMGRLFDLLASSALLENSIVVLYSNHGTGIGEDGRLEVGLPYRPFLHVPLLIRHPNLDTQVRVTSAASLVDLAPTLYSMLGIDLRHRITTHSMMSLIEGWDHPRRHIYSKDIQFESVRSGKWKMVIRGGEFRELYNLAEDPDERENIYENHPQIARELDLALTRKHLGWEPRVPLAQGLTKTITYFDNLLTGNRSEQTIPLTASA